MITEVHGICRDGEIGKHAGLKIQCPGKGLQVRFLFSVQPFVIKDNLFDKFHFFN